MKEEKCFLVINKPYSCVCCMCRGGDDCFVIEDIEMRDKFHDWYRNINRQPAPGTLTWENCPLRLLPKKIKHKEDPYIYGLNDCIEVITG